RPMTPEPAPRMDFECLRTHCFIIREGTELRRLAQAILDAKRGAMSERDLNRAKWALQARFAFEKKLPPGDPQVSTQSCTKVAGVAPIPPSDGNRVVNTPVDGGSFDSPTPSTAVTAANDDQVDAIRSAIDSLVATHLPAGLLPAYKVLMDQYTAILEGRR
ncbi:hypothetical protein LX36DRAFT_571624, partial [Colletotrichum falcatum]